MIIHKSVMNFYTPIISFANSKLSFSSSFRSLAFSAALPSGVSWCFLAADAAALASNSARCLAAFSSRMSSIFFFFFRWMAFGWSPSSSSVDLSQASLASSSSSSPSHLSDGFTGSSFFDVPGSKSSASDKRGRI